MISLITAHLWAHGRSTNVIGFFARQSYKDFEFILVDQNPHFILREMVAEYASRLTIQYIRSEAKGLSLNRNIGLDYSRGEIVAFPDDDCFLRGGCLGEGHRCFPAAKGYCSCRHGCQGRF